MHLFCVLVRRAIAPRRTWPYWHSRWPRESYANPTGVDAGVRHSAVYVRGRREAFCAACQAWHTNGYDVRERKWKTEGEP